MPGSGRRNRSKHGGRLPPTVKRTEPRSAAGTVGAAERTRLGAEQRARMTAVAGPTEAQNSTSGVLAVRKHSPSWAA